MTVCSQTGLCRCHVIYWLTANSRNLQMKKISTEEGRGKEVLNGRKTRSDEQNGPYVSGRVEEGA